jgi:hypothetical protein
MQLKKRFGKGCHIFATHMEDAVKDKVESIEGHSVLRDFEYFFGDISRFPPNKYIDFSIDLVSGASLVSKAPYRMGTPKLKDLQM